MISLSEYLGRFSEDGKWIVSLCPRARLTLNVILIACFALTGVSIKHCLTSSMMYAPSLPDEPEKERHFAISVKNITQKMETSDGTFFGLELRYIPEPQESIVHCVGGNFRSDAWMSRSCHFQHLCLADFSSNPHFVIMGNRSIRNQFGDTTLSTAPQNKKSFHNNNYMWSATVIDPTVNYTGYYELNATWMLFSPLLPNLLNPGHMLGDFLIPMHILLQMFDVDESPAPLHLISLTYFCSPGKWNAKNHCYDTLQKYLQLLGGHSAFGYRHASYNFQGKPRSNLICARHAVAGMGYLTDHGLASHGQADQDYESANTVGRGRLIYNFRQWSLKHMGFSPQSNPSSSSPRIVLSVNSSQNVARQYDFAKVAKLLPQAEALQLANLTLSEQLQLYTTTSVFVSVMGGASLMAMYMPRGATVILCYGTEVTNGGNRTVKMDWAFWNHVSHLRVHWIDLKDVDRNPQDLIKFIQGELDIQRRSLF